MAARLLVDSDPERGEGTSGTALGCQYVKRKCEKAKWGCDAPGGFIRRGMALADVVLAICVGVEIDLAGGGGGNEGRCGGEEGGDELHLGSQV